MTILDHPTALPPAASEPPASPLDGIEIPAEGAAQHLPDASRRSCSGGTNCGASRRTR